MEEGTKTKKTVFVGGVADEVDESAIVQAFQPFGDIIEVQLPPAQANPRPGQELDGKHRGFAFVTFSSSEDAQDAIDNMDMNELKGKVLKVNLARPMKTPAQLGGNRAVWESEEWLKEYAQPVAKSTPHQLRGEGRGGEAEEQNDNDGDEAMEE